MHIKLQSVLGAFLMCLILTFESHAQSVHGVFKVVKGDVKVRPQNGGQDVKVKIGQKVMPKDLVIVGVDSRAKIVMIDGNELNLSPETQLEIQNYEYKPASDKKNVLLNVIYGNVRSKVNQKYEGDNKFQVKTPTAVAGVRGTDFFTSYSRETRQTKVVTFEGRVAFGLPGPGGTIRNEVFISKGETTSITANQPPEKPVEVPKSELAQMDSQTDAIKAPDMKADSPAPNDAANKNESPEKEDKQPINQEQEKRAPASVDQSANEPKPMAAPGTMLLEGDLPSSDKPNVPPIMPVANDVRPGVIAPPLQVLPPKNDFINETISSGSKKLSIIVTPN